MFLNTAQDSFIEKAAGATVQKCTAAEQGMILYSMLDKLKAKRRRYG